MRSRSVPVEEFVSLAGSGTLPLIDSRSENEFGHAHIPGAINIPILKNEERTIVGTDFKQRGREEAIETGFKLVGPRFHDIIIEAKKSAPQKEVLLYCWRGGLRSQIMAWLLEMNGFNVTLLEGGYKAFRNFVLKVLTIPKDAVIIGGPTGSGKTELLNKIREAGGQVLQLEELAHHKGSAFGGLGQTSQPSNEYFENRVALQWNSFNSSLPVWIENESRSIGSCLVPDPIFSLIRTSHLVEIIVGDQQRRKRILDEYGVFPVSVLSATTNKIGKRLGPQHLKNAVQLLENGDLNGWLDIVLGYYDKLYAYGSLQREPHKRHTLDLTSIEASKHVDHLMNFAGKVLNSEKVIQSQ